MSCLSLTSIFGVPCPVVRTHKNPAPEAKERKRKTKEKFVLQSQILVLVVVVKFSVYFGIVFNSIANTLKTVNYL